MTTQQKIEQEAVKEFAESKFTNEAGTQSPFITGYQLGANFALDMDRWVRVEDGLPEENKPVLFGSTKYVNYGYRLGDTFHTHNCPYRIGEYVTHWQPLPAPPQP